MADMTYRFLIATKAQLEEGIRREIIKDNFLIYVYDSHEIFKGSEKFGADNFIVCEEKPEKPWPDKLYCINGELFHYMNDEWIKISRDYIDQIIVGENELAIPTSKAVADLIMLITDSKANATDVYTKEEVDGMIPDISELANTNSVYTKEEVDAALSSKANATEVYSRTDLNGWLDDLEEGKADKSNVYTKEEVDAKIPVVPDVSDKADKATTLEGYGIENAYTKSEVDSAISAAVTGSAKPVYTIDQVDEMFADKADKSTIYTKDETNALLADKANSSDVYTKEEVDAMIPVVPDISGKADKSEVYTKDQVDWMIPDVSGLASKATTLAGYGIENAYTKSEVDTAIANAALGGAADSEAITALINNISDNKADKATSLEGYGITDAYSKSEVDSMIPDVSGKADKSSTYTKSEIDGMIPDISGKADKVNTYTKAQVDAKIPDISDKADKATTLSGYGITDAYTKVQVDAKIPDISGKADKATTYTKTEVDGLIPDISVKADKSSVYTKSEVDQMIPTVPDISGKADKAFTLAGYGIADAYTRYEVEAFIVNLDSAKADKSSVYTKEETDSAISTAVSNFEAKTYTTTQVNDLLADKADIETVYTKAEVDAIIPIVPDMTLKADKANTYTKAEVDALIPTVPDVSNFVTASDVNTAITTATKDFITASDIPAPVDISGKADKSDTLAGYGITNAYSKSEVDAAIANAALGGAADSEAITQLINGISEQKADKSTTLSGYGITDSYTKTEVNTAITNATKDFITADDIPDPVDISDKADKATTYTKTETEDLLDDKVDKGTVYTKSEVDAKIPDISGKADKATTISGYGITDAYTKSQVDALIPNISGKADKATTLSGYGITNAYTKTEVDAKIPNVSNKADKATTLAGYGITDAYTKSQVDAAILAAVEGGSSSGWEDLNNILNTETLFNVNSNMYHSYRRDGYRAQTMCYDTVKKVWYIIGGPTTGDGTTRIIEVADLRDFPSNPIAVHILNCGHANDSTYNPDTQMLYITTGYDANSNTAQEGDLAGNLVCEIDTKTMQITRYIPISEYTMIMKVEWNAGLFYIGDFTHGSIYDGNFNLVGHIPSRDVFTWSDAKAANIFGVSTSKTGTQGITCINGEIHAPMWGCTGKFGEDVKDIGIIYRYALTGEYIGYYMIAPKRYGGELEAVAYKDGAIYSLWYGTDIDFEVGYIAGSVEEQGIMLREGDNLDDCRALTTYHCNNAAMATTLLNCPAPKGFTMYVLQNAKSNLTQLIVGSEKYPSMWARTWYDQTGWETTWHRMAGKDTETFSESCYCAGFVTNACKDIRYEIPLNTDGSIDSISISSLNLYVRTPVWNSTLENNTLTVPTGGFLVNNLTLVKAEDNVTLTPGTTVTLTLSTGETVKILLNRFSIRIIITAATAYGVPTNLPVSCESTFKGTITYTK